MFRQMTDDMALVREYARNRSETAFATLVSRHLNLVYSVALREVRDPHLAEEVAQAAFIILARKAGALGPRTILSGWLCRTARYVSAELLRSQHRRQRREQEAYMQSLLNEKESGAWMQIAPLLETAMAQLGEQEHNAIVLRFYEGKALKQVGAALGTGEDAARMRINRALEKLRKFFARRGLTLSAALITAAVSANAVQAAPVGLATTVTAAAVQGTAVTTSTLTLIKGALKLMAWTKAKTAIVSGVVVLLAAGTATVTVKRIEAHKTEASWRVAFPDPDHAPSLVEILPTKFPASVATLNGGRRGDNWIGVGQSVFPIVQIAYDWRPGRILFADPQPKERYDFISTLRQGSGIALQAELKRKLGFVGHREMKDMDILVLKVRRSNAPGLKPPTNGHTDHERSDYYYCDNEPLSSDSGGASSGGYSSFTITSFLEGCFGTPVIDQTGLTQHFHIDLKWEELGKQQDPDHEALKQALLDQLGLELVPSNMPIEMLVVEKVK
jgi:uncharacterized protein (TIGR03435 family)